MVESLCMCRVKELAPHLIYFVLPSLHHFASRFPNLRVKLTRLERVHPMNVGLDQANTTVSTMILPFWAISVHLLFLCKSSKCLRYADTLYGRERKELEQSSIPYMNVTPLATSTCASNSRAWSNTGEPLNNHVRLRSKLSC